MYSFAQRKDTTVVDEPLYAYYLHNTASEAEHPGVPEILASQSTNGEEVVRDVILGDHYPTPVVVHKQMTHHLLDLDKRFLHQCKNVLLIRDPRAILASYTKVVQAPTPHDIGIPQQLDLFQYLRKHDLLQAIVDTPILLRNPGLVLQKLCGTLDIPFTADMLSWEAGARPEDGVWAPYWYKNVHQSTGFKPYQDKQIQLPPSLMALAESCRPVYEALLADTSCIKLD